MARSRTKAKMTAAYLPLSIISIILSRLPPKSISRFKCVSKSWSSLIRHPEFYKQQLLQSNQHNPSFFINKTSFSYASFASIDHDTSYRKETLQQIHSLGYASSLKIIGSCNGVICLSCKDYMSLCLYNPTTNQSLKLPDLPQISPLDLDLLGFGFDHKTNHFKVVAYADWDYLSHSSSPMWDCNSPHHAPISTPAECYTSPYSPNDAPSTSPTGSYNSPPSHNYDSSGSPTTSTEIYYEQAPASSSYSPSSVYYEEGPASSSYSPTSTQYVTPPISPYFLVYTVGGTDSWEKKRKASLLRFRWTYSKVGEHLNGALHWVVTCKQYSDNPHVLISFDLAEEEYKVILPPNYGESKEYREVKLGVLGGCLSICTSGGLESEVEIWIMKDYGVEESWEKVFTICQLDIARPLWLSKKGEVFLARDHDLLLYDPKCDTVAILKCRISDIRPYVRSFVPLACEGEDVMISG